MGFQKTVNAKQPFGVVGELHDSSVKRVSAYKCATGVKIGNPAFRFSTGASAGKITDVFASGTAGEYLGIIVNPKEFVIEDGSLEATLSLMKGSVAQVASLGHINVQVCEAVKAGNNAYYKAGSGWCASKQTGSTSQSDAVLGKFITDGGTGETVAVAVDTLA